jgi:hypothetical protein
MTGSHNGSTLIEGIIRRAAEVNAWPPVGSLAD